MPAPVSHDYRQILKEQYDQRCAVDAQYSLRKFAHFLGFSSARLSHVLGGRYGLSVQAAHKIAGVLSLSNQERDFFCLSVQSQHARSLGDRKLARQNLIRLYQTYQKVTPDHYSILANWYHFAILELTKVEKFVSDSNWVSKRLGITKLQAELAVERLLRSGLMVNHEGIWKSTGNFFANPEGGANAAVREFHRHTIDHAKKALETHAVSTRDFSNLIFAIDPDDLPFLRKKVNEFREELDALAARSAHRTQVYSLNLQLFSLEEMNSMKGPSK